VAWSDIVGVVSLAIATAQRGRVLTVAALRKAASAAIRLTPGHT
jgi:hypothetical protein